jgi:hypothetical protein
MSLERTNPFLNQDTKLSVSAIGATPSWTEIPWADITPNLQKVSRDTTTNANVDTDGNLWASSVNTKITRSLQVKTMRFENGNVTPAVLDALDDIEAAGESSGSAGELLFKVEKPDGTGYSATFSVDTCIGWGGTVDAEAQFTFTITQQGAPTAL